MSPLSKKIIILFILVSFLSVAFFSLSTMIYDSNGYMTGDCPFAFSGKPVCPQDILASVVHHISTYSSFFNVPMNYGLFIVIMFVFSVIFVFIYIKNLSQQEHLIQKAYLYIPPLISLEKEKITHWLSLLENSPSDIKNT